MRRILVFVVVLACVLSSLSATYEFGTTGLSFTWAPIDPLFKESRAYQYNNNVAFRYLMAPADTKYLATDILVADATANGGQGGYKRLSFKEPNTGNNAYWNLKGCAQGDILDHTLQVSAARYTPVNAGLIPTGELAPVAGTPFDFTRPRRLGEAVDADDDQIRYGAGYDHNFVLDHPEGALGHAATLTAPDGMAMEVWTDQPGMQVYTGNYIPDGLATPEGPTCRRGGVALETQHFADSVNHPDFPSVILRPGQEVRSVTEYRFPKA